MSFSARSRSPGRVGAVSRHAGKLFGDDGLSSGRGLSSGPASPLASPAITSLEESLGREEANELQELFRLVDKDAGGSISPDEFVELLHTMSVRPSPAEMDLMYDELDSDRSGSIEYAEFLRFMTCPGVASANGAKLIRAFQAIEGFQYELGLHHPAASGRTGHAGFLSMADFNLALRTFLPDKIRNEKEANELLRHIKDVRGVFDYRNYVRSNVNEDTLPPTDEHGDFVFPIEPKKRRPIMSAKEALRQATENATHDATEAAAQTAEIAATQEVAATSSEDTAPAEAGQSASSSSSTPPSEPTSPSPQSDSSPLPPASNEPLEPLLEAGDGDGESGDGAPSPSADRASAKRKLSKKSANASAASSLVPSRVVSRATTPGTAKVRSSKPSSASAKPAP